MFSPPLCLINHVYTSNTASISLWCFRVCVGDGCVGPGSIPGAGPEFISPEQALHCSRQSGTLLDKPRASSFRAEMPELRYLSAVSHCMHKSKISYTENRFQEMCALKASRNGAATFPICNPSHAYPFLSLERFIHSTA